MLRSETDIALCFHGSHIGPQILFSSKGPETNYGSCTVRFPLVILRWNYSMVFLGASKFISCCLSFHAIENTVSREFSELFHIRYATVRAFLLETEE